MNGKIEKAINNLSEMGYVIFNGADFWKFECEVSSIRVGMLSKLDSINDFDTRHAMLNDIRDIHAKHKDLESKRL